MLIWLIQLLPYFVFAVYQFSSRSPGPPAPPPAVFCPPGVPFEPVHFTDYPLKSEYKVYTPEKILKLDPLACIQSAIRYNQQGLWIFSTPKLFRGKFNYLSAYDLYMELPVTPKPMPASALNLPTNHTGKMFAIVYITLTGVIDTIIPAAGLWSWVGKSASYLLKLAPLLWWALSAKTWPKLPLKTTGCLPKTGSLKVIRAYCVKRTLQQEVTTSYHPQANGRLECLIGFLVQLIAKLSQEHPNTAWPKHLPTTLLILQARINCGTGFSPAPWSLGLLMD
ncbi:hypothetical protein DSO57_1031639 [Entomophthora muscae]|uniref:Uncharacterized protein n=1 Tax=Entomophthora muscae TaxID=34485 RepID=A0ACC2RFB2_9FUNG|nr:hypothetical protein DSO57_1031639 [Entomophthora muscae]